MDGEVSIDNQDKATADTKEYLLSGRAIVPMNER